MAKPVSTHEQEALIKENTVKLEKEELRLKKITEKINELVEEKETIDANCQALRKTLRGLESTLAEQTPPRVVKLARKDKSLGFNVMGGEETSQPIFISHIIPGGVADSQGDLRQGDQILSVDGVSVEEATHDEAVELLKNAKGIIHKQCFPSSAHRGNTYVGQRLLKCVYVYWSVDRFQHPHSGLNYHKVSII